MMKIKLLKKKQEAKAIWSFIFAKPQGLTFEAGQFLKLFVPHENPDGRGIARYFTIAASPTEDFLMITTKIVDDSSTFKKALFQKPIGTIFEAVEPAGPFVLPKEISPCVLIAGGIGVTPYRSMAKFATDKKLVIPLKLIYANRTTEKTAYFDFFQTLAKENPNFQVFFTMTQPETSKIGWSARLPARQGRVGRINEDLIKEVAGDLSQNLYYLSGPEPMVDTYRQLLTTLGIDSTLIRLDYFPGYEREKV